MDTPKRYQLTWTETVTHTVIIEAESGSAAEQAWIDDDVHDTVHHYDDFIEGDGNGVSVEEVKWNGWTWTVIDPEVRFYVMEPQSNRRANGNPVHWNYGPTKGFETIDEAHDYRLDVDPSNKLGLIIEKVRTVRQAVS